MKPSKTEREILEFQERLNDLKDEKILEIIYAKENYQETFWLMAVEEAKKRQLTIETPITEPEELQKPENLTPPVPQEKVDDKNLPVLFSERAIFWFSMLFTPIAGALLFRSNLKRLKIEGGENLIVFSVFYVIVLVALAFLVPKASFGYLLNFAGGIIINVHYAVKYYPENLKYKNRPVGKQVIIGIIISIILAFGVIKLDKVIEKATDFEGPEYKSFH